jgi:hypothetical protein
MLSFLSVELIRISSLCFNLIFLFFDLSLFVDDPVFEVYTVHGKSSLTAAFFFYSGPVSESMQGTGLF